MNKPVYEVVDTTDSEVYWTLGVWPTLSEALSAISVPFPSLIPYYEHDDYDDFRRIEIRERPLGWGGTGKTVHTRSWRNRLDPDDGTDNWLVESTPSTLQPTTL